MRVSTLLLGVLITLSARPALAWDAYGHRLIARLGMEGATKQLGAEAPAWLRDDSTRAMIADQAVVPDRWRSTKAAPLSHINNPDHYLDLEDLEPYGLTLATVSPLRHEFVRQLTEARLKPGYKGPPVNEKFDPEHVKEYPGFLPQSMMEVWSKVVSSMRSVRILEKLDDPARANQLQMAKASVFYNMGLLAHFAGDAAQPLHTTQHHHGWVGPNPKGYTTDKGFHAHIDGGVIRLQHITIDDVRMATTFSRTADPRNPWDDVVGEIDRSFKAVEPLYELQHSGDLEKEPGRRFIIERMADGAESLAALYAAAWHASDFGPKDVDEFVKYDGPAEGR